MSAARYLGLNDLVEGLSRLLLATPLSARYPGHPLLVADVASAVQGFLKETLEPSKITYKVWQGVMESGEQGITPTTAFGNVYVPDLVVDVAGRPTLALYLRHVPSQRDASRTVVHALGTALLYSQQYPAVVVLLHCPKGSAAITGLEDREIMMELWSSHKVRLLLYQA